MFACEAFAIDRTEPKAIGRGEMKLSDPLAETYACGTDEKAARRAGEAMEHMDEVRESDRATTFGSQNHCGSNRRLSGYLDQQGKDFEDDFQPKCCIVGKGLSRAPRRKTCGVTARRAHP